MNRYTVSPPYHSYLHFGIPPSSAMDPYLHPYHHHATPTPAIITTSLSHYYPLEYPYTWYVEGDVVFIANVTHYVQQRNHGFEQETYVMPFMDPSTFEEDGINLDAIEDALDTYDYENDFYNILEETAMNMGLTEKEITKNLQLMNYQEEEDDEICVVCQDEFERKEVVGVLQCKHRYHYECIKEWLLHQNVCPLCKSQALRV
ncbi:hypothetical protein L1987_12652 [Smallanthus sonchifolius]|uniref:Uncharacterized protein n=1 Tax=Smallanthus sonchifolius TaxID=185202 RepID=A0ACB9JGJ1_9ASTR|nr:hypothetical protein L1987_12652 [Smallanthus sonchifolius]